MASRAALLLLLSVLAAALRVLPAGELLDGPRALPFPDDPPYHWMRLQHLLEGPVDVAAPDPLVGHPQGATCLWPWGFDRLLEAIAHVTGTAGDAEAARRATAWAIPILGALLVPLVYLLGARLAGRRPGLLAAALVAVMPTHVQYTLAGRVDHHVMEPLLLVLGLLGPAAVRRDGTRAALACGLSGLAAGISLGVYPAAPLPLGLTLGLAGFALALEAPAAAVAFALGALAGTAGSLPLSPHAGEWVFHSPSRAHLALVTAAGAGITAAALATRLKGGAAWPRALAGLAVAGLSAGATALAAPGLADAVAKGLGYLGSPTFARLSFEATPLLADPAFAWDMLGTFSPLAPLGLLALAGRGTPARTLAGRASAVAMLLLLGMALAQRRFAAAAAPVIALGTATALGWGWERARDALSSRGVRRSLLVAGAALLVAGGLFRDALSARSLDPLTPYDRAMFRAADVVAARLPDAPADSGALVPWGYGHLFQWSAGVPTVCDNFFGHAASDGALRRCLEFLYEPDPEAAAAMLHRDRVRWVVLVPPHPQQVRAEAPLLGRDPAVYVDAADRFGPSFASTAWARLGRFAQSASPGDPGPLGLRLLDRVLERDPRTGEVRAEVLVFEAP